MHVNLIIECIESKYNYTIYVQTVAVEKSSVIVS